MARIMITCTVPNDWRDDTDKSGIIEAAHVDVTAVLQSLGIEDIDIEPSDR